MGTATSGTVAINPDGTLNYTPNADFAGTDSFVYTVSDGTDTATATVEVTIGAAPDAPVATDDTATTNEDEAVDIDVLSNDTDGDGDALSVSAVGTATSGTVEINPDGTLNYTPNADFAGTDSFIYTVSDGTDTATATVEVTVGAAPDTPDAVDDTATANEDDTVTIDVLSNDTDGDGDALSVSAVGTATSGTVAINPDGTLTYTPNADFDGTDSFTYTVSDGALTDTAIVTVTVNGVNDNPTLDVNTLTITEGAIVTFSAANLAASDIDSPDSQLQFDITNVQGGTFFLGGEELAEGTPFETSDISFAQLTFQDDGDSNSPSYTVTVRDPDNGTASGNAEIFLEAEDDLPSITVNSFTIQERVAGGPLLELGAANLQATDEETTLDADFTFTISNLIGGEFFTFDGTSTTTFTQEELNNGDIFFRQDESETQPAFDVTVTDGSGMQTTVAADIAPLITVNDAPILINNQLTVTEGTAIPVSTDNFSATDEETSTTLTFQISDLSGGQFNRVEGGIVTESNVLSFTVAQLQVGQIQFVDDGDATPPSFSVSVSDGGTSTDAVPVTITDFLLGNDPPEAVDDSGDGFSTDENTLFTTASVLANDTDEEGETLTITPLPGGTLTTTGGAQVTLAASNDAFTYDPNGAFDSLAAGAMATDSFTYSISDGSGTDTATVTIAINGANDAPIAVSDSGIGFTTGNDATLTTASVLVNDSDADNGDVLTIAGFDTTGTQGLVTNNGDGTFLYNPNGAFEDLASDETATDTFTYTVSDSSGATATATVTIEITAISEPPLPPSSETPQVIFDYEQFLRVQDPSLVAPTNEIDGLPLAQLFDENFYLNQNPDIAEAVNDGVFTSGFDHFVEVGIVEGRNPSILYNEAFYLANNPDVANAVATGAISSGLEHFLNSGHEEGRDPSNLFDQSDYLTNNSDVAMAVGSGTVQSAFEHYIEFGIDENRLPALALYNEAFYVSNNSDVADGIANGIIADGFEHYVLFGQNEGRSPSSLFNESSYLAANPDVQTAVSNGDFTSGFAHFEEFGRFEGRAVA